MIMTAESTLTPPLDLNNNGNKGPAIEGNKDGAAFDLIMVEELWKQNFETIKTCESVSLIDLSDSNNNIDDKDNSHTDAKAAADSVEEKVIENQGIAVSDNGSFSDYVEENVRSCSASSGRDSQLYSSKTDVGKSEDSGIALIDTDALAKHDLAIVDIVQKSFRAYVKGFSENVSKRMDEMQELMYDFMDQARAHPRRQMETKSTQTDTSISCQSLSTYLTKKNASPTTNLLRPVSPAKDENVDGTNKKCDKKSSTSDSSQTSSVNVEASDQKCVGNQEKTFSTAAKASLLQRSVWLDKDGKKKDDVSEEEEAEMNESTDDCTAGKMPVMPKPKEQEDVIKSAVPWHDNNKEWVERQIRLEEQQRKLNALLSDHLKKKPSRPLLEQKQATIYYSPSPSQKALQFADDCQPPLEMRQTLENNRFFDRLEEDYILPPHPRAQLNENFLDFRKSRRSEMNRRHAHNGRSYYGGERSSNFVQPYQLASNSMAGVAQLGNSIRNGSPMSAHMRRDESQFSYSPQKSTNPQYRQQQGDNRQSSIHPRSVSQPHRKYVRATNSNNFQQGAPIPKMVPSGLPAQQFGRHERRFVEAQKLNVTTGRLTTPNKARLSPKIWTQRGNGVFTSDEEESFVNPRLGVEDGEVLSD